jgi:hypothetical protein
LKPPFTAPYLSREAAYKQSSEALNTVLLQQPMDVV